MKYLFWFTLMTLAITSITLHRMNVRLRNETEVLQGLRQSTEAVSSDRHDNAGPGVAEAIDPDRLSVEEFTEFVARSASETGSADGPGSECELLLLALAERDPARASALALEKKALGALLIALREWGQQDPDSAIDWYRTEESKGKFDPHGGIESRWHPSTFPALLSGIARDDPARALRLVQERSAALEFDEFIRGATHSLDRNTLPQLTATLLKQADPQMRNSALRIIATELGSAARFVEATKMLEETARVLPDGEQDLVALAFIQKIRIEEVENRAELAEWVAATAPEDQRAQRMRWFVGSWAGIDFEGAGSWLREQEPSQWWDMAALDFAERARDADPETAEDWARAISDPGLREQALQILRNR